MVIGTESVNVRVDEPVERSSALNRPLTRRGFVTKGMAVVGLGTVLPAAFVRSAFAESLPSGVTSKRRVLVVVQLGGGNDGLNTVIPYSEGKYYDARPRLAVSAESVLQLNDQVGLHPSMVSMKGLFDQGKLAVIQGVGYPNPNRSHFRSMEIWHTASMTENAPTGWLGRLLDATHHEQKALWKAANIGSEIPQSRATRKTFVPSRASVQSFGLRETGARRTTDGVRLYAAQAAMGGALALLSQTGTDAYESTLQLKGKTASYKPMATYPGNALGTALKTSAQLISSNLGTGVCYVTTGGFDTHVGQPGAQTGLLKAVSDAVAAFQDDLAAQGMEKDVMTLIWTEFGRRVKENGSSGTDHGTAGPVFVVGGGINGGLFGETPSVRNLDDNGDLKFSTDFRSVYSTLLSRWFQTNPKDVLPENYPEIPLWG